LRGVIAFFGTPLHGSKWSVFRSFGTPLRGSKFLCVFVLFGTPLRGEGATRPFTALN
jgi:hypothetical protein